MSSRIVAKVNDPVRAKAYAELGIATLCRTGLMMDALDRYLGLPPSGLPGMLAATGHHHDDSDTHVSGAASATAGAGAPTGTTPPPNPAAAVSQEA